jgi:tetratricopeptide (TPR) repeat protein
LQEAETRFQAMLDRDPNDARAAAGMGFLRMQQNNFGAAISFLVQSEQNGFRDHSVVEGLATSRFWYTMGEASLAFDVNQLDVATEKFKAALDMRPRSPEALTGLAGIYSKNQQWAEAAQTYQEILKIQPGSADAWRGLFLSYARDNKNAEALALMNRFPAATKASLNQDPDVLRTLAGIYHSMGRDGDAQKILAQALALPFPDNGTGLKTGTRLQYAAILMDAKRYDQAAEIYKQVLNDETENLNAWMGLVTADHQLNQDNEAIALVEKMPPATYEAALADAGFLSMLGSIYQQSNQLEIAQGLLERAAKLQAQTAGRPSVGLQIQLAAIYLQRNDTAHAYSLYHDVLAAQPDNLDAWRGMIGTLQSTNRTSEALQEIKLIPPAIRKQLEADVQFEQTEASLYAAAGDTVNATAIFNRVQQHYAALRQQPPADVEIQSAYLLYNTFNDRALYPALMRLGSREDLTDAQRETIQGLWANWSVRRATTAFEDGYSARAIEILDAAAQAFPENLQVRKAVAGGYLRAGKSREALAIYKQLDMQDASAGDFQGAINASLAANDKSQTEAWLRQALDRFPRDASILALAARFEQARGDNARAADYWRASLAAMPEVSPANKLAHELVHPDAERPNSRAATPNDLAHLLNPDLQADPNLTNRPRKLPVLPSYGHDPYDPGAPVPIGPGAGSSNYQYTAPSTTPSKVPVYPAPNSGAASLPISGMPQEDTNPPVVPTTTQSRITPVKPSQTVKKPVKPSANQAGMASSSPDARSRRDSGTVDYSGRMHLPPAEQTITITDSRVPARLPPASPPSNSSPQLVPQSYPQAKPNAPAPQMLPDIRIPQRQSQPSALTAQNPYSQSPGSSSDLAPSGLRLSAQPMSPVAARAQALLADETDSQLTQGFAIHYLPNATGNASVAVQGNRLPQPASQATGRGSSSAGNPIAYSNAQYTPSAQDAAAGAYSAPKQPAQPQPQDLQPPPLQPAPPPVQPAPAPHPSNKSVPRRKKSKPAANTGDSVPTLVTAPGQQSGQQPLPAPVTDAPVQGTQSTTGAGLSDQELQERNLPPLRGPWARITHKEPAPLNPRDEAEMQLRTIEGGYSAWLGGTGVIGYRTGSAGFDALTSLEASFEASVPLGTKARFTFIGKPVFLDSGQADGNAQITLTSGVTSEPFGTLSGTAVAANPPGQQNAVGLAGEGQLTFANLAVAFGTTPRGFLVNNFTARASWRPGRGPFTFTFNRDSVKDTQLSYSGLRDPGSATAFFPGNAWGGVIANQFGVQYARGDLSSGFYMGAGGQYLTGYHVLDNKRIDGSLGAYFRVFSMPEYGTLNVGANFFGMHYTTNLQAFTYGMGGYFSPQAYFLGNVPITWTGHYLTRWHYTLLGSIGVQAFQLNKEPLYPLDEAIEISQSNPSLPNMTSVGPNYDLRGQAAYAVSDHWFVGGFAGANNSRNYTSLNAGFSIRYLFRSQPSTVAGPTGLFQIDEAHALRPLTVP